MSKRNPFKRRQFEAEIILLCVRWYLRYTLSYRDLEEMMLERGLSVDHTTIFRWVQHYAPELEKRCRPSLQSTNDSYRVDETYIKVKGAWKYLYRAVDSEGNTIDFLLCAKRDARAAERFFRKALKAAVTLHSPASLMSIRTRLILLLSKPYNKREPFQPRARYGRWLISITLSSKITDSLNGLQDTAWGLDPSVQRGGPSEASR
jgi:hypothetical protein